MKKSIVIIGLALLGIALYIALPTADKNEGKVSTRQIHLQCICRVNPQTLIPQGVWT